MALAGSILALLSAAALLYGLFLGIFKKGKRRRGWIIAAVCAFFFLPLGVGLVPVNKQGNGGSEVAFAGAASMVGAEQATQEEALNGFPDRQTLQQAKALGIQRYEAYQLLNDEAAIARYCDYEATSYGIETAKHSAMDAAKSNAQESEIWDEYERQQTDLIAEVNSELGLIDYEFSTLSNAGYWNGHCRAQERGWEVLTLAQAKSASRNDASKAREATEAFYAYALSNQISHFFNRDQYNTMSCTWKGYEDFKIVGCRLEAVDTKSDWDLYAVGRLSNGELAVAPLVGTTDQHISQSGISEELNRRAKARRFFDAYGDFKAYFAVFAGPPFNIKDVRDKFPR